MPKFKTLWGLLAFQSSLVLALLGIVYIAQVGVVAMIFGEHMAFTYIYPILSVGIQILSYLAIVAILYLMGWSVVSYVKNRGKPDKPSEIIQAINALTDEIVKLRKDVKEGACKYVKPESDKPK